MIPVQPGIPEKVTDEMTATWFPCGHILGAASVGVETPEGRVLFSGDISWTDQLSVAGMSMPPFRPDQLVLESTYGDRMHADRTRQEEELCRQVAEAIEAGGKVLIPAFAIGRAQEVLLILRRAMKLGRIKPFPVWVDGLVKPVCSLYVNHPTWLRPKLRRLVEKTGDPFFGDLDEFSPVSGPEQREKLLEGPPCAIVASSGMLSGGASVYYARRLVGDEKALIAITGYQDEEAPGRRLIEASEGKISSLTLQGQELEVKCKIRKYHLSAHADASELVGLAARLRPADTILVHGEGESRERLASQLASEPVGRVHLPRAGTTMEFSGRKNLFRGGFKPIGGGRPLAEGAAELALRALELRGERARWQVAQLLRLWGETDMPLEEAERILVESGCFVRDPHRPFTLRFPRKGDRAGAPEIPREFLEKFGARRGLYRWSADPAGREILLRFHFPKAAERKWAEELDAALKPLGWSWRIHPSPHSGVLVARAKELVEKAGGRAVKASLHLEKDEVVVRTDRSIGKEKTREIEELFREETGMRLVVENAPSLCLPRKARRKDGRLEINAAFDAIEKAFRSLPHRPYKKRLLAQTTIELLFISPRIGERYRSVLKELEKKTGWPIRIGSQANQHRIKEIALTLTQKHGLVIKGNPRYYGAQNLLRVRLEEIPDPEEVEKLREEFREDTGFELELETG